MNRWGIALTMAGILGALVPATAYGATGRGKKPQASRNAGANAAARSANLQAAPANLATGQGLQSVSQAGRNAALHEKPDASGHKAGSRMSETQKQNVDKLVSDLQSIKTGSQVTPEQKQQLSKDLMAMADGATKPSQQSVNQLATDLQTFWSDQKLSPVAQKKLMADVGAVLSSANIPASEVQATLADAQAILKASGVDKQDAATIVTDLKAIAAEVKKNVPAPPASP